MPVSTTAPGIAALFPTLTLDEFRAQHWPDRYLAYDGPGQRLCGLDDSKELEDIRSLLQVHHGPVKTMSTAVSGEHFEVPISPARAIIIYKLATPICLGDVHQQLPMLDEWRKALARELAVPERSTNCSAYATPAGKGVPWHFDNREIFVVQLQGHKQWQIADNTAVAFPTQNYGPGASWNWDSYPELGSYYHPSSHVEPVASATVEMRPGSVLFLPRGTWHRTVAHDDSLSLTFGLFTPMALELLLAAIRSRLVRHANWREPQASATQEQRAATRRQLETLVSSWSEDAGQITIEHLIMELDKA